MTRTKPQIFIIESLEFEDEASGLYEGKAVSRILALSGKDCHYVYIRTKAEFEEVLEQFWDSQYRYLHLSCHGSSSSMDTTLDSISFPELGEILSPYLEKRRLFVSACKMSCRALADHLIPKTGCISLLGPSAKPYIADAAIFWASFYHSIFRLNPNAINEERLLKTARGFSKAFSIPLNYFGQRGNHVPIGVGIQPLRGVVDWKSASARLREG